jgi:hypothetical protein
MATTADFPQPTAGYGRLRAMKRKLGFLLCMIAGGVGAYFSQPYAAHNSDVILVLVTVFSVFAGFLIAIITIIGDPIMIKEGSWRIAELGHDAMRARLFSHIVLFIFYLLTIGLLFVGIILERALVCEDQIVKTIVEWCYLFFGITSFLFTFGLPVSLWNMQKTRYEAEIERRRARDGIHSGAARHPTD